MSINLHKTGMLNIKTSKVNLIAIIFHCHFSYTLYKPSFNFNISPCLLYIFPFFSPSALTKS